MSIWRWADWITPVPEQHRVTLGEGNTPLVRSTSIGPAAGLENLWLKLESGNPAGSFKDRFGAAAISAMRAENQTRCVATSSGNTGSAWPPTVPPRACDARSPWSRRLPRGSCAR